MASTLSASSLDDRLTRYFASDPAIFADPYPLFREVREAGPVVPHGPIVLATTYAGVKAVLADSESIRTKGRKQGSLADHVRSQIPAEHRTVYEELHAFEDLYIARHDGPEHYRIRQTVHRAFTPRRIAELGVAAQRYLDELLEPLAEAGGGDLRRLAYRLPLMVITDLLGVPLSDGELIHGWSNKIGRSKEAGAAQIGPMQEAHAAIAEFKLYVAEVLEEHRRRPRETGLVAALMGAEEHGGLSTDELTAMFVLLLFAGHETTTNLVATGTYELLRRRSQWETLCTDPGALGSGLEELIRYTSPVQFGFRLPIVDVEIEGVSVPAGTAICQIYAAANRDPAVFEEPDRLDVRRPNARDHIAFGFGPHYCLGQALARLEGELFFRTMTTRFPGLELASDELGWTGNAEFRTLTTLPVGFG